MTAIVDSMKFIRLNFVEKFFIWEVRKILENAAMKLFVNYFKMLFKCFDIDT